MDNHGLVMKQKLTEAEIAEIEHLTTLCNNYENLNMRVEFGMMRNRSGQETNDFLYYEQGAIVGYLGLDDYGTDERELVLMVHPDYRRQGIGRKLLHAAQDESRRGGITRLILVCERFSQAGPALVHALGAKHDYSEYEMTLSTFRERGVVDERLFFRKAGDNDVDMLISILAADFGDEESAQHYVETWLHHPNQHFYVATFGEKPVGYQEPVGVLRLDEMEQSIGVYGFFVLPDYQGRGYGRQMLEEAIRIIRSDSPKPITIEVDTTNARAMGLYLSVGFDVKTTYDYYAVNV
jgi:ribosomal protein S18 acetylase RimI-like enzyme